MVKNTLFLFLVFGLLGCDPDSNVGERPLAPVLLDLTTSVPLNEKGIRPDPNSSGILLDWEQDEDSKVAGFVIYRSNLAVGDPPVPYSFREIARVESGGTFAFTDTTYGVNLDTTLYYKMKSFRGNLESDFSNVVSLKLIEKPMPNSPNGVILTKSPKFMWSLVSTTNDFNFTIRVREYLTKVPVWICTTAPDDSTGLYDPGNQFIRYGTSKTLSNSTLVFVPLQSNKEYEWKITSHSGFTPQGDGTVIFTEKKASTSKWVRFKVQ